MLAKLLLWVCLLSLNQDIHKGTYNIGNVGKTASMSMFTLFESRYYTLNNWKFQLNAAASKSWGNGENNAIVQNTFVTRRCRLVTFWKSENLFVFSLKLEQFCNQFRVIVSCDWYVFSPKIPRVCRWFKVTHRCLHHMQLRRTKAIEVLVKPEMTSPDELDRPWWWRIHNYFSPSFIGGPLHPRKTSHVRVLASLRKKT